MLRDMQRSSAQSFELVWGHGEEEGCHEDEGVVSRVITLDVKAVMKEPLSGVLAARIALRCIP